MYITIENEIITGVYCGDKQEGFIEVPDTFNGYVGCSVNHFDSNWNLLAVEPEPEPELIKPMTLIEEVEAGIYKLPKGQILKDGSIYQMTLVEQIEAGLEELPIGWKINGDVIEEMNMIEKMQAKLEDIPKGFEIIDNQLIEIMTPEKLMVIEQMELQSYLASTDWYVTRLVERLIDIPDDVKVKRLEAINRINEIKEGE